MILTWKPPSNAEPAGPNIRPYSTVRQRCPANEPVVALSQRKAKFSRTARRSNRRFFSDAQKRSRGCYLRSCDGINLARHCAADERLGRQKYSASAISGRSWGLLLQSSGWIVSGRMARRLGLRSHWFLWAGVDPHGCIGRRSRALAFSHQRPRSRENAGAGRRLSGQRSILRPIQSRSSRHVTGSNSMPVTPRMA